MVYWSAFHIASILVADRDRRKSASKLHTTKIQPYTRPDLGRSIMSIKTLNLLVLACLFANPVLAQDTVLIFDHPQTAGISGFRADWNIPIPLSEDGATHFVDSVIKGRSPTAVWSPARRGPRPGVLAFDALNRSLLVRFPGSSTAILNQLQQGYRSEERRVRKECRSRWSPYH